MLEFIQGLGPIETLFFYAFLLSVVFGFVARMTSFCPLGGVADVVHSGNTGRLSAYFFAIAIAMLAMAAMEFFSLVNADGTRPPYRMSQFRWPGYVLGGFVFGVGMTLCRGCGMKNMINLGGGNLKALVAIAGMGGAAVTLLYIEGFYQTWFLSWMNPLTPDLAQHGFEYQDLGTIASTYSGVDVSLTRPLVALLLAGLIIWIIFRDDDFTDRFENIIGGLFIGGLIAGAYYLSGGPIGEMAQEASDFMDQPQNGMGMQSYTFIRPMGDMFYVAANPLGYLVTFGLVAFLGVGAGALIYSILTLKFRLQWFASFGEFVRYAIGGVLVGIGGILGMGCTLGQGIAGTSTLALGSFVDLFALLLGAWLGIKFQSHFMDDHEVPGCKEM